MVGNSLFETILIDKLQINIDELGIDDNFLDNIRNVLSTHYPTRAYTIKVSRGYFSLTFTPTRYFKNTFEQEATDTNLQIPTEQELYDLFVKLGFYDLDEEVLQEARIPKIHLTKNFYTKNTPPKYIEHLSTRSYKRLKPIQRNSNSTNSSLILAPLKKNTIKQDIIGDKKILFYDKVQELLDKASLKQVALKYPLSDDEISLLPKNAYNAETKELNLNNLHILRCELQYKYTKLKGIANILSNKTEDNISLYIFCELLKENQLYKLLDEAYTQELLKNIFYNKPSGNYNELNNYEKLLAELISRSDNDFLICLMHILQENNYLDSYKQVLRKIQKTKSNNYYDELYNKLNPSNTLIFS